VPCFTVRFPGVHETVESPGRDVRGHALRGYSDGLIEAQVPQCRSAVAAVEVVLSAGRAGGRHGDRVAGGSRETSDRRNGTGYRPGWPIYGTIPYKTTTKRGFVYGEDHPVCGGHG
jgi:hypothetical protein